MRRFFSFLVFALLLHSDTSLVCQILPIDKYTVEDGLISNSITNIYQDSRGFLWIGSDDGLSIFDGVNFENYSHETSDFGFRMIYEFLESRKVSGRMWISAKGGVSHFENGVFTNFRLQERSKESFVRILLEDPEGNLWCHDANYVYTISQTSVSKDSTQYDFSNYYYHQSIGDSLTFGLHGQEDKFRMYRLQDDKLRIIPDIDTSGMFFGFPIADRENTVWIPSRDSSLIRWSENSGIKTFRLGALGRIQQLLWDFDGNFWGRFSDGFRKCTIRNDSVNVLQTIPTEIIGSDMYLTLVDAENTLWFTVRGSGIAKLDQSGVHVEFAVENVTSRETVDKQGHIWIGMSHGVREFWKTGEEQWVDKFHRATSRWPDSQVRSIVFDSVGRLIMTFENLETGIFTVQRSLYDSSVITCTSTFRASGIEDELYGLTDMIDSQNRMWSCKADTVVLIAVEPQPRVLRRFTKQDGLFSGIVNVVLEDREGNFWLGNYSSGLNFLSRENILQGKIKQITNDSETPTGGILTLYQDRKGTLWIGTKSDGLYSYDDGKFRRYGITDGLPGVQVSGIIEDYDGRLWVQTSKGTCFQSEQEPIRFRHLPEIAHENGNLFLNSDSTLILGAITKIVIFDPRDRFVTVMPPGIFIRKFLVNGVERTYSDEHEFAYDENNCQIEYTGVSLRDGKAMRYQYQIGNEQTGWSEPMTQRNLWLASLQPGDYAIRIRAVNPYDVVSVTPAVLRFKILLPFWRRWWFILSAGMLFGGGIYSLFRWRTKTLRHEQQIQQEAARRLIELQESERKRIAGEIHDSLGQDFLVILNRANMGLKSNEQKKQVQQLQEIYSMAEQAIDEARAIAYNLSPYHLEQVGLTAALQSLIDNVASTTKISFTHQIDSIDAMVNKEVEVNLFRIVQECVNNIVKHSEATEASVEIKRFHDSLEIYVRDNGKGFVFDSHAVNDIKMGFGLFGLQERVRSVHGSMSVRTAPGNGAAINFLIPIHEGHEGTRN